MERSPSIYQAIADAENSGKSVVLCEVIRTKGSTPRSAGSKMLVFADGTIIGSVGGGELENRVLSEARLVFGKSKPIIKQYEMMNPDKGDPGICGGVVDILLEPISPAKTILIIGAGHVGIALAQLAKWAGMRVAIWDDREEQANSQDIDADEVITTPCDDFPSKKLIDDASFVVFVTRGSEIDMVLLPMVIQRNPKYIGVIGSKKRWQHTKEELSRLGQSEQAINSIHSPIGIDINAETPEEIAVSIMAEIISKIE